MLLFGWLQQLKIEQDKGNKGLRNLDFKTVEILSAAKAVIEMYGDLISKVRALYQAGGVSTVDLRKFSLPATNKTIVGRGNYLLSKNSSHFGSLIVEQLEILAHYPQLIE